MTSQDLRTIDPDSPVSAVAAFDVEYAEPSDHLSDVARRMQNHHIGALFVRQREGGVAILTERDIVRAVADGSDAAWAVDCMTRDLISVPADTSIADAADTVLTANIRHLAVEREDGVLGIVSIKDLLEPLVDTTD
jgi:CBS domain-containing protein